MPGTRCPPGDMMRHAGSGSGQRLLVNESRGLPTPRLTLRRPCGDSAPCRPAQVDAAATPPAVSENLGQPTHRALVRPGKKYQAGGTVAREFFEASQGGLGGMGTHSAFRPIYVRRVRQHGRSTLNIDVDELQCAIVSTPVRSTGGPGEIGTKESNCAAPLTHLFLVRLLGRSPLQMRGSSVTTDATGHRSISISSFKESTKHLLCRCSGRYG